MDELYLKIHGVKGENISYFGVAGLNYLFYIQNGTLKDVDGSSIATGINGSNFSHVYYKDGQSEYMILYGNNMQPTRHKLPLSSYNTPEIVPEIVLEELPADSSYEGEDVVIYKNDKGEITKYKKIE